MKITNGIGYEANKYIDKTTANQEVGPEKSVQGAGNITKSDVVVDLSQASKELQTAQKVIQETPGIRIEKVETIKTQVINNTYQIDHNKVAEKIVGAMIDEWV